MQRLITPRLILRPFEATDWDAVRVILADPASTRFMHVAAWTEDEGREWFDWCVANALQPDVNPLFWAIARRDAEGVIGWLGIETSSDPHDFGERYIGYLLHYPYWNQGLMTEALRAVLASEFDVRGASQLRASCDVANPASARVMEKAGMRREKTEMANEGDGEQTQRHYYLITRAEYDAW